ncbi:uncharacterized protein LOC143271983 isoform X2 [Peromyscus maniculatus bairdii]|uniref:uncharacterized protein LOC143271983 isoform X2 n=1 Tax=Peromyscus maniculatus bairdii TaxID=230844 RepID=UPI003FD16624
MSEQKGGRRSDCHLKAWSSLLPHTTDESMATGMVKRRGPGSSVRGEHHDVRSTMLVHYTDGIILLEPSEQEVASTWMPSHEIRVSRVQVSSAWYGTTYIEVLFPGLQRCEQTASHSTATNSSCSDHHVPQHGGRSPPTVNQGPHSCWLSAEETLNSE